MLGAAAAALAAAAKPCPLSGETPSNSAAMQEQSPGEWLTGVLGRYSWCPCSRSPAGYVRVRRLSPHSPSCMLLWTVPSFESSSAQLSSAQPRGSGRTVFWHPCVMDGELKGWFDEFTEQPE